MRSKLIIASICCVLGYALIKGYDYYKRLKYRFYNIVIDEIIIDGQTSVKATLQLQIYNPTPIDLTLNSILGKVYINNFEIGTVNQVVEQNIVSSGVSTVNISVEADPTRLSAAALAYLVKKQDATNWLVTFDGSITVASIPVSIKISKTIKSLLDE